MKDWVKITLIQYKLMRTEMIQSLKNQLSTLQVGMASIGVLIAAGISIWDKNSLVTIVIFLIFVPVVSYLALFIWIGEVTRMMRVGKFNSELENKINAHYALKNIIISNEILNWENYLRTKNKDFNTPQILWSYKAIIGLFLFNAASSTGIAYYKIQDIYSWTFIFVLTASVLTFLAVFYFIFTLSQKLKKS